MNHTTLFCTRFLALTLSTLTLLATTACSKKAEAPATPPAQTTAPAAPAAESKPVAPLEGLVNQAATNIQGTIESAKTEVLDALKGKKEEALKSLNERLAPYEARLAALEKSLADSKVELPAEIKAKVDEIKSLYTGTKKDLENFNPSSLDEVSKLQGALGGKMDRLEVLFKEVEPHLKQAQDMLNNAVKGIGL
ncbi:MAG: hypothetical protein SFY92_01390 [Verrucomicrobiae bacterium]|nr:hypothetical protein [Verrucomicrobiae bacterium]